MRLRVVVIVVMALWPMVCEEALAQAEGKAQKGRDYALRTCTPCHVVTPNQPSPRRLASAGDFRAIAKTPGITEKSLHAFLSSPHPSMPDLILSQKEQNDVIAYILSLRDQR